MNLVKVTARTVYLNDYAANADKFYRTYTIGAYTVFQWGRRSVLGQFKVTRHVGDMAASTAAQEQIIAKQRKGYNSLDKVTFDYDLDRFTPDKQGETNLSAAYDAAARKQAVTGPQLHPDVAPDQAPDQAPAPVDALGAFTAAALDAITQSVTDPKGAASTYAKLNGQWTELEATVEKAKSYLDTLDQMILGASS